jgi:hypothetical protein
MSSGINSLVFSNASTAFFFFLSRLQAIIPEAFKLFLILFLAIRVSVVFFFLRIAFRFTLLAAFFT